MTEEVWSIKDYKERDGGLRVEYAPTFVTLSREEGEADMRRLVNAVGNEGCWLFDAETERWYNITAASRGHIAKTIGGNLSEFGRNLTHYHFHPRRTYQKGLSLIRRSVRDPKRLEMRIGEFGAIIASAVPSDLDMPSYVTTKKLSTDCDIDFRIGTPFGRAGVTFNEGANLDSVVSVYQSATGAAACISLGSVHTTQESFLNAVVKDVNTKLAGILSLELKPYE